MSGRVGKVVFMVCRGILQADVLKLVAKKAAEFPRPEGGLGASSGERGDLMMTLAHKRVGGGLRYSQ